MCPNYDYECPKCHTITEHSHGMNEEPYITCDKCDWYIEGNPTDVECHKVILSAPAVVWNDGCLRAKYHGKNKL